MSLFPKLISCHVPQCCWGGIRNRLGYIRHKVKDQMFIVNWDIRIALIYAFLFLCACLSILKFHYSLNSLDLWKFYIFNIVSSLRVEGTFLTFLRFARLVLCIEKCIGTVQRALLLLNNLYDANGVRVLSLN